MKAKKEKPVKLKKTNFTLLKNVRIGEKDFKKGEKVALTEKGRKSFKKLNYI
ncbi:MAG: hypothetical protein ABFS35_17800 [Bacteroidota bacterium]